MPHSGTGKRVELQPLLEPIFLGAWSCLTPALPSTQGSTPLNESSGIQQRQSAKTQARGTLGGVLAAAPPVAVPSCK